MPWYSNRVLETRRQLLNITAQDVLPQLPSCLFRIFVCYAEFVFVSYAEENVFLYACEFFCLAFKEVPKWCIKLGYHGSLLLFFHLVILWLFYDSALPNIWHLINVTSKINSCFGLSAWSFRNAICIICVSQILLINDSVFSDSFRT